MTSDSGQKCFQAQNVFLNQEDLFSCGANFLVQSRTEFPCCYFWSKNQTPLPGSETSHLISCVIGCSGWHD